MAEPEEPSINASVFGQSFGAKGTSGIVILSVLCMAMGMGWLLYDRSRQDRVDMNNMAVAIEAHAKTLSEHSLAMQAQHLMISKGMESLVDIGGSTTRQLKIQNWIILSNDKEKERIKNRLGTPIELQ